MIATDSQITIRRSPNASKYPLPVTLVPPTPHTQRKRHHLRRHPGPHHRSPAEPLVRAGWRPPVSLAGMEGIMGWGLLATFGERLVSLWRVTVVDGAVLQMESHLKQCRLGGK
jgi:hypothetical protein